MICLIKENIYGNHFLVLIVAAIYAYTHRAGSNKKDEKDSIHPNVSFTYKRKPFFMTKKENEFLEALIKAVDGNYYIFPQVHLSAILDHKVSGQNWKYALRYINQKSVDYVICDKQHTRPLVAIELNDWSHDKDDRKQRDINVDHMMKQAGVPLLWFKYETNPTEDEVVERVREALKPVLGNSV